MSATGSDAPGAPGVTPTWSPGAKDAIVTSLGTGRVWATVGHGIVNEVYWPSAGDPQIRDLGFLVAGEGFWQEVKVLPGATVTTLAPGVPIATVRHGGDGWTLTLELVADPQRDVILIGFQLQGASVTLYPLLAPHLEVHQEVDPAAQGPVGGDNTAWVGEGDVLLASRPAVAVCLASYAGFTRASAGYVGVSDGWQDFNAHGAMTWTYPSAGPGNVALIGECAADTGLLALAFASDADGARTLALESLDDGIDSARMSCLAGWQAWGSGLTYPPVQPGDPPALADALTRGAAVLRSHEDRTYAGAIVASLSVPWGDTRSDLSGYHLVWSRDASEAALALLALGDVATATRALGWFITNQQPDGHWQQNVFPDGTGFWMGTQLDETAFPVILAAKLADGGHALPSETAQMVRSALTFLVANGPLTAQDRWEENPGASPFTLGVLVAAMVGGAALLKGAATGGAGADLSAAEESYLLALADNWNERIESWAYATGTELDARYGVSGHYVRIGPPPSGTAPGPWGARGFLSLANQPAGAAEVPAQALTGLEFLYLPRLGLRAPTDQRIVDTVTVVEGELGQTVATGRSYHRYEHDGYGEGPQGQPFDGTGEGRLWPLLAGERGHYELICGRPITAALAAMTAMAGAGGLIPEQIWDAADLPAAGLLGGLPTGSAMPLVWAHAELIKLAVARASGRPVEQLAAVLARYDAPAAGGAVPAAGGAVPAAGGVVPAAGGVVPAAGGAVPAAGSPPAAPEGPGPWYWRDVTDSESTTGATAVVPAGRDLVIDDARPFTLHWGHDGWQQVADLAAVALGFGRYGATLPAQALAGFASLQFTRDYADSGWEGSDHAVILAAAAAAALPAPRAPATA